MKRPEILAFGEPMLEFNHTGDGGGRNYLQGFGGDTSNFIIAAARQGVSTGYITAIGDDPFGKMFQALWLEEGVDTSCVKIDPEAPTAAYFVNHDAQGHHFTFFRRGSAASRYSPGDLPHGSISGAKFLHLSGITLAISTTACEAGLEAMALARAGGVKVSFDTNLRLKLWSARRAKAVITEAMRLSDICLPSVDDIVAMGGSENPDDVIDHILALGPSIVALKLGAQGAIVADAQRRVVIPPHPCTPVDATGAGDCFGGAFIARMAKGDDMIRAARYACAAAALKTEGFGAVAPIPCAKTVLAAISAH